MNSSTQQRNPAKNQQQPSSSSSLVPTSPQNNQFSSSSNLRGRTTTNRAGFDPMNPPPMTIPGLSGHTTLLAGNTLLVYGGLAAPFQLCGECYTLDLSTFEWNRLLTAGAVPSPRAFHSAVMDGWRMLVFGGVVAVGVQDVHYNSHNCFAHPDAVNLLLKQDRQFGLPNDFPPALMSNVNRYVPGCDDVWPRTQQHTEYSSLHILDVREKECNWIQMPAIGFAPAPRAHHSAAIFRKWMYIAGGYSVYGSGVNSDPDTHACATLHGLDLDNMLWRKIETSKLPWPARWGFASAVAPEGQLFFVGGVNPLDSPQEQRHRPEIIDECLMLDLKKRSYVDYTRPDPEMTIGPRRCVKAACAFFGGYLIVHGGLGEGKNELLGDLMMMNIETGEWTEVKPSAGSSGEAPSPRCGHTATIVSNEFIIFGGLVNCLTGKRSNDAYAFNLQNHNWRRVGCFVSEYLRRTILVPPLVDEALILDPLPPKPKFSVDEIRKAGSTNYVPPSRKLPWDILQQPVDRMQHDSMEARFPLGTAVEEAVRESLHDAKQANIALRRSKLNDEGGDDPVVLWGDESTKTAVANARTALAEELNLRVKRLDDFTAAASSGVQIGDTLRQHFSRDVAPILRDATKWRETAAMTETSQLRRTDPFQDILFGFQSEVRPMPITVNTKAVPIIDDPTFDDPRDAPIAKLEKAAQSYSTGLASYQKELEGRSDDRSGLHKPSIGVRFVSGSIKRLGLETKLRVNRGDQPNIEDAQEQMKNYLAQRQAARAEYNAKRNVKK